MRYDKLVRDRIPAIIREKGEEPFTHIADEEEYWDKLKAKLQEEVEEFLDNPCKEELADIFEVICAISEFKEWNTQSIEQLRVKKAEERGVFKGMIILDETKPRQSD